MWGKYLSWLFCYYPKHTKYLVLFVRKKKKTAIRDEQRTWIGNPQNVNIKWPEIKKKMSILLVTMVILVLKIMTFWLFIFQVGKNLKRLVICMLKRVEKETLSCHSWSVIATFLKRSLIRSLSTGIFALQFHFYIL